jgi:hypothetical protein
MLKDALSQRPSRFMDRLLSGADTLNWQERFLGSYYAWRLMLHLTILELFQNLLNRCPSVELGLLVLVLERVLCFSVLVEARLGLRALSLSR